MWKNVRAIMALSLVVGYIIFTGYEVWNKKTVPDNFYTVVSMVIAAYYITRANNPKGGDPSSPL